MIRRPMLAGILLAVSIALPAVLTAQQPTPAPTPATPAHPAAPAPRLSPTTWRIHLALGFVTSILAHEAGHVVAAYAVGGHPSFRFHQGKPTIYSGIDPRRPRSRRFIFSSAGLTTQALLNEAILDIPHARGGPFERGLLAGGIATVLFYITIGRNADVSDVSEMAGNSSLSKGEVSLIYGGVAALQTFRIARDHHYARFFAAPTPSGRFAVGLSIRGD